MYVSSYLRTSKMTGVTLLLLLAYLLAILTNLLTTLAHLDRLNGHILSSYHDIPSE